MSFVSLVQVCEVTAGQSAPQSPDDFGQEGSPFIRAGSLENLLSGGGEDACEHISDDVAARLRLRLFPKDTILFAKSGMSATLGRIYRLKKPAYVVSHLAAVIPSDDVDPGYLQRWFERHPPSRLIPNDAYPSIRTSEIGALKIELPTKEEQKRIAAILEKAETIRRKREQAIQLADAFLRSVFLDMFGDPVTNPKGWKKHKLGEIARIRRGASPRPIDAYLGGDVPWIKIGDGTRGSDVYIEKTSEHVTKAGAQKSVYLEPGSLIFANCGVSLGFARILKIGGCIHDGWLAIDKFEESLNDIYLLKLINSITKHFRAIAPEGTQPNLNTAIMKEFEIPVPPLEKQRDFARIVARLDRSTNLLRGLLDNASKLFESSIQRAFQGVL